MTNNTDAASPTEQDAAELLEKFESGRTTGPTLGLVIGVICILWTTFQIWIASPFPFMTGIGLITGVPARAVHLTFGLVLAFLIFPAGEAHRHRPIPWYDIAFAVAAGHRQVTVWFAHRRDRADLVRPTGSDLLGSQRAAQRSAIRSQKLHAHDVHPRDDEVVPSGVVTRSDKNA